MIIKEWRTKLYLRKPSKNNLFRYRKLPNRSPSPLGQLDTVCGEKIWTIRHTKMRSALLHNCNPPLDSYSKSAVFVDLGVHRSRMCLFLNTTSSIGIGNVDMKSATSSR